MVGFDKKTCVVAGHPRYELSIVKNHQDLGSYRSRYLAKKTSVEVPLVLLTIWLFNIAMENDPFIDDFPSYKPPFIVGFPWLC